jgi:aspartokinase-like uncharacterized kinase
LYLLRKSARVTKPGGTKKQTGDTRECVKRSVVLLPNGLLSMLDISPHSIAMYVESIRELATAFARYLILT